MDTITLTLEATPENIRKIAALYEEEKPEKPKRKAAKAEEAEAKAKAPAPAEKEAPAEKPAKEAKPDPAPEKAEKKITKADIRKLGLALTKADKTEELSEALSSFGAKKLSEVKEEDYAALYEKLEAISCRPMRS